MIGKQLIYPLFTLNKKCMLRKISEYVLIQGYIYFNY